MDSDLLAILNAGASASPSLRPSGPPSALSFGAPSPFVLGGDSKDTVVSLVGDPVQWGPSLVLIRDHMAICGGCIGLRKNNCFCLAPLNDGMSKGCTVGKHALVKHPLVTAVPALSAVRVYLHKGVGKNVAYAEPWVDVSSLSTHDLSKLLGRRYRSWDEWKTDAAALQAATSSNQDLERVHTAVKATKVVPRLPVAGKALFNAMADDVGDLEAKLKTLGANIEGLVNSKELVWVDQKEEEMSERDLLEKEVMERVKMLQQALLALSSTAVEGIKEFQLGVIVRLAGLEGLLGSFSVLEGQLGFEGATMASAIEYLQEQVEEIRVLIQEKNVVAQVMNSNDMTIYSEGLKEAFRKVMGRILKLEEKVEEYRARDEREHRQGSVASVSVNGGLNWFGETGRSNRVDGDFESTGDVSGVETGDMKEKLKSLAERMDAMEQNGGLNSKMEGEDISVFFMGVRFSSERDVSNFVRSKSNVSYVVPVGLVTDCYSIFYELNREIFDSKNKLGVTDLAKVAQLAKKQADVYNILAGVEHGLPDFFDPPASSTKIYIDGKHGKKHRFGNIPSYEVWGPIGADGFTIRKKAKGILARLVTTRKTEILEQVKETSLQSFLLAMLDMSKEFVLAVFSFLTEEYAALYQHFDDGGLCWDFACSCVEHVFKHEFEAARAVVRNPDVVDDAISTKILWQSLRTIAVQETFMRVGFKNHSSLSSAYSRFLLTQYQKTASELSRVSKEMDSCKKLCADLAATVEAVEKRLKAAEGTANAAQNAIQRMKRGSD